MAAVGFGTCYVPAVEVMEYLFEGEAVELVVVAGQLLV